MRKTMRIAGIFLAIMMLFTLTSCTPKTAEKGKEKMEKKGYNVVTTSTDVNIGDLFSTKTEAVLVCSKEVDGKKIAVTAAFYKDAEEAKARYEKVKDIENEERNIRLLKQTMEEYIRGKVPTIKVILMQDFIKTLDMILIRPKPKARRGRKKVVEEESA